jgi:hypothetical protein
MLNHKKVLGLGIGLLIFGFALSAQAGPAMFEASFIMHAWGNDISTGTVYPYNTGFWRAAPVGHDCQSASPYTPNGGSAPRYCTPAIGLEGSPQTGSGTLVSGGNTVGGLVALPQSAFIADVTGFLTSYYPYLQSWTYGTFFAEGGTFFAGSGPAAAGTVTKTGMGQQAGTWYIRPRAGGIALGGALGMLGRYGVAWQKYVVPGKAGTYSGSSSWNFVQAMGIPPYNTIIGYTPMGETLWKNPAVKFEAFVNNLNGNTDPLEARASGTLWTTGTVTVLARDGIFTTILKRTGYDNSTGTGTTKVRNIQLVTPTLSHWNGAGFTTHTGQIGILKLTITPEPEALLMLAAGGGLLALLYWARRRA